MGKVEAHRLQVKAVPILTQEMAKKEALALAYFLILHFQVDAMEREYLVLVVEVVQGTIQEIWSPLKVLLNTIIQNQTKATLMGKS